MKYEDTISGKYETVDELIDYVKNKVYNFEFNHSDDVICLHTIIHYSFSLREILKSEYNKPSKYDLILLYTANKNSRYHTSKDILPFLKLYIERIKHG